MWDPIPAVSRLLYLADAARLSGAQQVVSVHLTDRVYVMPSTMTIHDDDLRGS